MDNEHKEGAGMIPTRQEILADLRAALVDLPDTSIDERRAVLALEQVYKIREDVATLRDELGTLASQIANDRRGRLAEAFILSQHSGMKQANKELEHTLEEMGLIKPK